MSRLIAEFIMRGRPQAIIVALLGAWVPFLSQASLGLVTLRRGWSDGLLISFWAAVPVLSVIWYGNAVYTLLIIGVGAIVVTYVAAWFLRLRLPLSQSLWIGVVVAIFIALLSRLYFVSSVNEEVGLFFDKLLQQQSQLEQSNPQFFQELQAFIASWSSVKSFGFIALAIAFSGLIGLLVSRWWQGMLFNPGGFQQEFHSLKLSKTEVIMPVALIAGLAALGPEFQLWLACLLLPMVVVGLGVLHCLLKHKPQGTFFLMFTYFVLFVVPTVNIVLALVAISDVWFNYRKKFNVEQ